MGLHSSWSLRYRKRRFALFRQLTDPLPRPLRILDVGGTSAFWESMDYADAPEVHFVLLNVKRPEVSRPNFTGVEGDARDLSMFGDQEFDLVFSNSVLEHVGLFRDQVRMADEIKRVGRRWLVQTPNKWFPYEPHYQRPLVQFLPLDLRIWLVRKNLLGLGPHTYRQARYLVEKTHLLTGRALRDLFPESRLIRERALGLTKSWIVWYDGKGARPVGRETAQQ